ncbi:hypothetical protein G6F57_002254 [Rhizopus arrhizus]|uniref:GTP-binding protein n=1 Tax=Rhizopus oryzae TaxID=64495 RepID=A0A9P6XF03_RHIOR|nr:hypothetical protein G6F23_001048 [Rhizopus arrhizus]KAG1403408.1 hypothetical protein G6F58_010376 [Rhizopus delemar]KAG0765012.1 hypothetical protein G6F24_004760 [Rhizopus arrhizus]KAG0796683.1 hypothetical protein G6F21_001109 [Rhizopus arrhizus]KAG0798554.1 hypothetical protein G6F22_004110 [Rhizopus arrhizus]
MKSNKVLLMGKCARDTRELEPTNLWNNETKVQFLSNLSFNIWDCGGQDAAFREYFTTYQEIIFKTVYLLIYVFDSVSAEPDKDIHYYQSCLEFILTHSPNAKVFCLMHKIDLIPDDKREKVFEKQRKELHIRSEPVQVQVFQTSIWDESLYAAWSKIIRCLVPNINALQNGLNKFCDICEADEIVLFERTTLLVIANSASIYHPDPQRFEKISSIIKQFNLYTRKERCSNQMQLKGSTFTAYFDSLTSSTNILLIISDSRITPAATQINIKAAKKYFEKLEDQQSIQIQEL